jgi:peptidyl-prolyl cis-trans isomerase A (cyclophilin A)
MNRIVLTALLLLSGSSMLASAENPAASDGSNPRVKLETTLGDIVLELDAERAPITVQNFLQYVQDKHYEGLVFHRVIPDFMIQGGGFTSAMDEKKTGLRQPIMNEWRNGLKNVRGTVAMARLPKQPHSATAQFFINVVDNARLDQAQPAPDNAGYAVFGRVVDGMDAVDRIKSTPLGTNPKYPSGVPVVPVEPVVIKSATVMGSYDKERLAERAKAVEAQIRKVEADVQAAAAAQPAAVPEAASPELKQYLAKMAIETGKKVDKTGSGIYYAILKDGNGASPKPTDTVEVHYTGWLLNGTKFDSSIDRGQPAQFPLSGVIKGWTEGVGLMKAGEKRRLVIPPELAYGPPGKPPTIPPNSYLVFDIELLSIK